MTPLEQLILAARFNNIPLDQIIARIQGWIDGAVITGVTEATRTSIIAQLAGIETFQVAAFTDLLLSRVERSVIVDAAQEVSPEILFTYFGPLDSVTRGAPGAGEGVCFDILTDPRNETGWTASELQSIDNGQTGNVLTDGGGYNCRHTPRPII